MTESGVLDKVALVYGQMNEPPGARLRVDLSGLTMAEYFRDQGQDTLLFIDNIFRFVQAGSEVSALLGGCRARSATSRRSRPRWASCRSASLRRAPARSRRCRRSTCRPTTSPTRRPWRTPSPTSATTVLSRAIVEQGIYPAVDPLDSFSRALSRASSRTSIGRRRRACGCCRRYRDLQDIIAILGMDELSDEDKLVVQRAQDPALPLAAQLRRRAVHGHTGRVRQARGHDQGLPGDPRRQARRAAGAGVLWSARSRRPSRSPPARGRRRAGAGDEEPAEAEARRRARARARRHAWPRPWGPFDLSLVHAEDLSSRARSRC